MAAKRVLVIEDNDLNRKLFCAILKMGHYETLGAVDAETGLKIAEEHRPDLILMDIQLPGMDGLSATRLIKKAPNLQGIPVIALTAYAMPEDEQKALNAGCSGYISKPVDTRNFLDRLTPFLQPTNAGQAGEDWFDHKKKILIVDDNSSNIKILRAKLVSENYKISNAMDGEEALRKVAEAPPDLILLDVMMPGMDGFEVTRRLKKNPETKDIPVILVTALDEERHKAEGLEAGADDFLNKPVNTIELQARVNSLLRLKGYKDQLEVHNQCEKRFSAYSGSERAQKTLEDSPALLLAEDNEKDAKLLKNYLDGLPYRVHWVRNGQEVLKSISSDKVDIILLDVLLPEKDGFEICRQVKESATTRDIQVLMVTCLKDLQSKLKGIDSGADDYLIKPVNRQELLARLRALIEKKRYIERLHKKYDAAFSTAITDELSGLYNRSYADHFLEIEIKRAQRQKTQVALLMMDLDDFKRHNDLFGHQTGDRILKEVGRKIRGSIRETDLAARYGGEEFLVVLPGTGREGAMLVAEKCRMAIQTIQITGAEELKEGVPLVTASIGVAIYSNDDQSPESLVGAADKALYAAKRNGKNRVKAWEADGLPDGA